MAIRILAAASAAALTLGASADFITAAGARTARSLAGEWSYVVDPQETGFLDYRHQETPRGYFLDLPHDDPSLLFECDFDRSPRMRVPGAWNCQAPELLYYEGSVWLRTTFDAARRPGRRTVLRFGAVNYEAHVYLNGRKLGRHVGGFTPFDFDVTDLLREGRNSLVVKADSRRRRDGVPTDIFDWWNWGGVTGDVTLIDLPELYMADVYLQAAKGRLDLLEGEIELSERKAGERTAIEIPELGVRAEAETGADGRARFAIPARPEPWSPERPRLYRVAFVHGGERVEDDIGFRTVEAVGRELRLNGRRVFLRGACLHDEATGARGRVSTRAEAEELIARAKRLGCNFLRLAHYPHSEHTVRAAERAGIMLWSEIPTYWTIDWTNPGTLENARAQLRDNIRRDRSRCNVIIWSVANETPRSEARNAFLSELVRTVRAADPNRLVSFAMELRGHDDRSISVGDDLADLVDVVSFNQYTGWYHPLKDAARISWVIPYEKPVIVSEFGGGAKLGLRGDESLRFSEDMQAAIYRENLKMLGRIDGLAGLAPWILSDFRSPRRNQAGVQDGFNRKGLTDEHGREKLAFGVLRDYYGAMSRP